MACTDFRNGIVKNNCPQILERSEIHHLPKLFVDRHHFDIIEWKKCFWFITMFLHVTQTRLNRRFSFDNNRVHVTSKNFSNRHLKAFVRRFAKIDQTAVLKKNEIQ